MSNPKNDFEKSGLKFLKKTKTSDYEYESIKLDYTIHGTYRPDFYSAKLKRIIEFKGHFRVEDKRKMVAVKNCNPELDIRFVFYRHNVKNERWCKKHGFGYAVKEIPKEWLK